MTHIEKAKTLEQAKKQVSKMNLKTKSKQKKDRAYAIKHKLQGKPMKYDYANVASGKLIKSRGILNGLHSYSFKIYEK